MEFLGNLDNKIYSLGSEDEIKGFYILGLHYYKNTISYGHFIESCAYTIDLSLKMR